VSAVVTKGHSIDRPGWYSISSVREIHRVAFAPKVDKATRGLAPTFGGNVDSSVAESLGTPEVDGGNLAEKNLLRENSTGRANSYVTWNSPRLAVTHIERGVDGDRIVRSDDLGDIATGGCEHKKEKQSQGLGHVTPPVKEQTKLIIF
jgi:hypothetical protein